jgi:uncharacterized protein YciI
VRYFVVMSRPGPAWDPSRERRQQDGWDEHAEFMDGLVDDGFIILGGPLGAGTNPMLVIDAQSEEEVRKRLAPDPWMEDGTLEITSVEPWEILLAPEL